MKKLLLLFLILSYNISFSQEEESENEIQETREDLKDFRQNDIQTSKFTFGFSQMDLSGLSTYLGVSDYKQNLYYWGFGDSHSFGRFYYDGGFTFFLNQRKDISDTSKTRLNGLIYKIQFGYDLVKPDYLDIFPLVGFGYQHMMLHVQQDVFESPYAGIDKVNYMIYNPAFIFDFGLEVRVPIYKDEMFLSLKGGYRLDVSDKRWKYDGKKLNVETDLSGAYAQFSLIFKQN